MMGYKDLSRFGPSIIDPESGYAINIPVIYQLPPFWWEDKPNAYASVLRLRNQLDIRVDDWDGQDRPVREAEKPFQSDELPEWALRANRKPPEAQRGV